MTEDMIDEECDIIMFLVLSNIIAEKRAGVSE